MAAVGLETRVSMLVSDPEKKAVKQAQAPLPLLARSGPACRRLSFPLLLLERTCSQMGTNRVRRLTDRLWSQTESDKEI